MPFLVFFFDTYIFYNVAAAFCSATLAWSRALGKVSTWSQLLSQMPQTMRHFDRKLVCRLAPAADYDKEPTAAQPPRRGSGTCQLPPTPRIGVGASLEELSSASDAGDGVARRATPLAGATSSSVSDGPTSAEWQSFGRAWNEVVHALRESDLLSDGEYRELIFVAVSDPDFFGCAEYTLLPCMLTSPVYVANPIDWSRSHSRYRREIFDHALHQARDLTAWVLVRLGVVRLDERDELLEVLSEIGTQWWAQLGSSRGAERDRVKKEGRRALLKLRASLTKLFRHLLQLHASPEVRRALQSGAAAKVRAAATAQCHALTIPAAAAPAPPIPARPALFTTAPCRRFRRPRPKRRPRAPARPRQITGDARSEFHRRRARQARGRLVCGGGDGADCEGARPARRRRQGPLHGHAGARHVGGRLAVDAPRG